MMRTRIALAAQLFVLMVAGVNTATAEPVRFKNVFTFTEGTCAITEQDQVWCWGRRGALGLRSWSAAPLAPSGRFVSMSGDWGTACLLGTDAAVYCVGEDRFGVRSADSSQRAEILRTPARLTRGPLVGEKRFRAVSAEANVACAVTETGEVWCWGRNRNGEFGNGSRSEQLVDVESPARLASQVRFVDVGVSQKHACALTDDGGLWCWGTNEYGQLGDGTTTDRFLPARVSGGHRFRSFAIDSSGTCGVELNGEALCWGGPYQIGDGTTAQRTVPTPVAGDLRWRMLARHGVQACGLTEDGLAYCWGRGIDGVLGTGSLGEPGVADRTFLTATVPQPVVGGHRFKTLDVGYDHACGITLDAEVWCWGGNAARQLGQPKSFTSNSGTPLRVEIE